MGRKSVFWISSGLAAAMSMTVVADARAAGEKIQLQGASYGYAMNRKDVKEAVTKLCDGKTSCTFKVTNETLGTADPSPGDDKGLMVFWKCGDAVEKTQFAEGRNATVACK